MLLPRSPDLQSASRAHQFLAIAGLLGVVSLASAAFNLLEAAAWFLLATIAVFFVAGVYSAYRRLPGDRRSVLLSRRVLRRSAIASFLSAVLLSLFWWFAFTLPLVPLGLPQKVFVAIAPWFVKLDFVPSLFSLLLPVPWRSGFHQYFRGGMTYCFPGPFWWEAMRWLRVAIPGYFSMFMLAAVATRFVRLSMPPTRIQ